MGKVKRKPTPESVTPLLAPIQALQNLLSRFEERGVIIGGVAVSYICGKQFPGYSSPHHIALRRYQAGFAVCANGKRYGIEVKLSEAPEVFTFCTQGSLFMAAVLEC